MTVVECTKEIVQKDWMAINTQTRGCALTIDDEVYK